jgi:heme exporter protein D
MWIVAIAWMYVALMMALAEATSSQGTVLGAIFTFLLYGVGPLALVMYLLGAPARRKAILRAEAEAHARQMQAPTSLPASADLSAAEQTDGGGLAPTAAIPSVGEEAPRR